MTDTPSVAWNTIHEAITSEFTRMENGDLMNGWTAGAVTDEVCYALRARGILITDIPRNCMEYGPSKKVI